MKEFFHMDFDGRDHTNAAIGHGHLKSPLLAPSQNGGITNSPQADHTSS